MTFTDDFSRYTWLYFLKKKSDVLIIFEQFLAQFKHRIKILCTDGNGEYCSHKFAKFCAIVGIQRLRPSILLTKTVLPNGRIEPYLNEQYVLCLVALFRLFSGLNQLLLQIIC